MDFKNRFALYEKLYFHELERREKISARLALPFAVLVATSGLLSFMLNAGAKPEHGSYATSFWLLFLGACLALAVGAWFFRKAWFGHTDKLLPTASAIEGYYEELVKTYDGYEQADELVNNAFQTFLFTRYAQFSSENAINNDERSYNIYRATVSLTISELLAFAASLPFFLAQQDGTHDQTRPAAAPTSAASRS